MKRLMLLLLFLLSASTLQAQLFGDIGSIERIIRVNPASTQADSSKVEGKVVYSGNFNRNYTRLEFSLTVITRGSTDSLNLYVQTSANPDDTTTFPWFTLKNFGSPTPITATGTTRFSFPTSVAARDTVQAVFPAFRVVEDHAPGTTGNSHAAADTSSWSLTIMQRTK